MMTYIFDFDTETDDGGIWYEKDIVVKNDKGYAYDPEDEEEGVCIKMRINDEIMEAILEELKIDSTRFLMDIKENNFDYLEQYAWPLKIKLLTLAGWPRDVANSTMFIYEDDKDDVIKKTPKKYRHLIELIEVKEEEECNGTVDDDLVFDVKTMTMTKQKAYLAAVQQDGWALQDIKEQTPEICMAAVREDGYALQ
jgi:hypothetical protein